MRKCIALTLLTLACALGTAAAHDMFLILADHDVEPHSSIEIALFNGTFDKSENAIDRDRMIDVSVVDAAGEVSHPETAAWRDSNDTSFLRFQTGPPGTAVVGISTKPRMIELSAEDFSEYLRHDGILDTLEDRQEDGTSGDPANERYSKHVKAILQVGGATSDSWKHRLGYPIEFVPLSDPNELSAGDTLQAQVLVHGEPLGDYLVYASFEGHHSHGDDGTHREAVKTRTNDEGVAKVEIAHPGRWYLRVIHMVPSDEEGVDYVSNWATLTFEVD